MDLKMVSKLAALVILAGLIVFHQDIITKIVSFFFILYLVWHEVAQ